MDSIYDEQFFTEIKQGAAPSAEVIVPRVVHLCAPHEIRSVVDIGCGLGSWLRVFQQHGASTILGIDGEYVDRSALDIPDSCFRSHDLTKPYHIDRQFDLAISLEVAEHLPPETADAFVGTLASLAPVVLFSAAIPGQRGDHHVNEQWPEYWAALFGTRNYAAVDCLRFGLLGDPRVEFWYQQNVMLFVDAERLASYPALHEEHRRTCGRIAPLVHREVFERWRTWGISQCNAYWEAVGKSPVSVPR
jgi:SAM-dependent methyltransferase